VLCLNNSEKPLENSTLKTQNMKKKLLSIMLFATSVGSSVTALAQDAAPAAPAVVVVEEVEEKPKVTISGYIDSYYLHAFNNPQSGNLMGTANNGGAYYAGRAFDRLTDQFALGLVQTKFGYSDKHADLVIDLTFGPNAELGNFGNQRFMAPGGYATGFYPANGNQSVLYGSSAAIKQAYFTWKATSKLSFTVGQFGTHIGYEVIDAPVNYHYSLSNLFNNGPFYHIGAKANYAISDNMAIMVGIVNNWDALTDWKKQKSFIAQWYIKPTDGFNIYLNYIGGHNDDGFKSGGGGAGSVVGNAAYPDFINSGYNRQLFDLTTGYQITSKFYLGLNAAYGFYKFKPGNTADEDAIKSLYQKLNPNWGGVAVYANYAISDILGIGARFEHFEDKYAVRYISATNNSLTITMPITLADGHLIVKPEFRADTSTGAKIYEKHDGTATNTQNTLGMAFIYKY
jgi:Putative beta-barrel porin-2, OmpL-like. bbp2